MNYFTRAYLRASTVEQDANRAKKKLEEFANTHGLSICNWYIENVSGAKLKRPALFQLLNDCTDNDILLVEDIDRLSRLNSNDWKKLKSFIQSKSIRIVAVNVPTTWSQITTSADDFDSRIFSAINEMLIDLLAAVARRDLEQRKERQAQGIEQAKQAGVYKGRKPDLDKYRAINKLLDKGFSWSETEEIISCSRRTIARAKKWREENQNE